MALIPLAEWARKLNKNPSNARQHVARGNLEAQKIGRDWFVEESASWPDNRMKSGKYVGWRKKEDGS